jgi:TetR/AcrR family transcriptional regulator, transcriptional repressor for nem operon
MVIQQIGGVSATPRERILFAAMQLFAEKGYNSTSVMDILREADVNAGSMYHVFPGKQDVLLAVLDMYHQGIEPMLLAPAWNAEPDPIERVFALLESYRQRLVITECTYGCPIGSIALELHEPDPAVRERLAANFDAWVAAIEACFVEAGARLPDSVDRRGLAVMALTSMEGGVMLSRTHRTLDAFDDAVRMYRDYLGRLQLEAAR